MRMQIRQVTAQPGDCERISHHGLTVERPQNLSAGHQGNNEHRGRLDLQILFAPNLALQRDAIMKFFQRCTRPDDDSAAHDRASRACEAIMFSARFACSQNASISSRETFSRARPLWAARRSMVWNRRTNFALALLKAI